MRGNDRPGTPTPSDLRAQRRREQRRLLGWVLGLLVVAGGLAIALAYGVGAAGIGLVLLAAGAGLVLVLWLILRVLEWLGR